MTVSANGDVTILRAPLPSDPRALEREIELRRARLAATIDELAGRVQPSALKERAIGSARRSAVSFATDSDGALRVERVGAVAAAVVGAVVLAVWRRRRR
ncbi:DUF3618 domain-containing protein [Kineococcus glutinatus]|uniref:DUF3618 domain-containing protein n=1 Tax=Kineococcus glutinatus TaxID=1070872 RepID=A0ABP9I0K0_9ACTN